MELADVVRNRRMVRSYDPDVPVPREQVQGLLELALRAPSAGNTQGWHVLVLDDAAARERYWTATAGDRADRWLDGMRTAPVLVVLFSDRDAYLERYARPDKARSGRADRDERQWPIPYWHVDTGMLAMILLLAAEDAGLGACFFGVPAPRWQALADAFAVPSGLTPVGVVSLGAPAADARSRPLRRGRKTLPDVVEFGSF